MAKKPDTNTTEKTFSAVAKQFIKYSGKYLKAGDKFQVKESDIKELKQFSDITIPEVKELDNNQGTNEDSQEGTGEKEGE